MISLKASIIFQLFDGFSMKPLGKSASVFCKNERINTEYREGGYYVVVNLPDAKHELTIKSPYFQTETITVETSSDKSAVRIGLILKPSAAYPFGKCVTRLVIKSETPLCVADIEKVEPFKIAQDNLEAGSSSVKLYIRQLPSDFCAGRILLFCDGKKTETAVITAYNDSEASLASELKHPHKRGVSVFLCGKYKPVDGSCFAVFRERTKVAIFNPESKKYAEIELDTPETVYEI